MDRLRILDGVVETSLRVLCLLNVVGQSLTRERIVAYDYFALYYHDIDENEDNLYGEDAYRSFSYLGENEMITRALHLLLVKKLIDFDISSDLIAYKTSNIGCCFFDELKNEDFASSYIEVVQKVNCNFSGYSNEQLDDFVQLNASRWYRE